MQNEFQNKSRPANRKWTLVGMVLGTLVGAIPLVIPGPIHSIILWSTLGATGTVVVVLYSFSQNLMFNDQDHEINWAFLVGWPIGIGLIFGTVMWLMSVEVPEEAIAGPICFGFLGGYAIVEYILRRIDQENEEFHERFRS